MILFNKGVVDNIQRGGGGVCTTLYKPQRYVPTQRV